MLGYRLPLCERLYRRWFETAKAKKRRLAREHKEKRQWRQLIERLNPASHNT